MQTIIRNVSLLTSTVNERGEKRMTSSAGISPTPRNAPTVRSAAAFANNSSSNASFNTSANPQSVNDSPSISPRFVVDPRAGVITQYLNNEGKITNQFPSNVVVAYLRAGLTQDGSSANQQAQAVQNSTTV
jgi:hypothetical protein